VTRRNIGVHEPAVRPLPSIVPQRFLNFLGAGLTKRRQGDGHNWICGFLIGCKFDLGGHPSTLRDLSAKPQPTTQVGAAVQSASKGPSGSIASCLARRWVVDAVARSTDRLAALNPAMAVAGDKKPGAPDSPSTIQDTQGYLQDFDRVQKTAKSDRELFDHINSFMNFRVADIQACYELWRAEENRTNTQVRRDPLLHPRS